MSENWATAGAEARRLAILRSYPVDRAGISEQLDRLAALAAKLCDTPIGLVSLVEADRQRFVGRSGMELTETAREHAFCDLGRLADFGMVVPDAREDARFSGNPLVTGAPGIRLYASQPLRSLEGAPLGTLCVIDTRPRPDLSRDQIEALRTLADAAMGLLERWRLDGRRKTEAARSKTTLYDLEQRFQILADVMPQMVWSSLSSGRSDYFNRLWCDYTGAPVETSLGDGWMQFLHPDDVDQVSATWQEAVRSGGSYDLEYRLRRADGVYHWMLVRGMPMCDEEGTVYRWLGTCTDIHDQKLAADQHALLTRELSHRIKNIFAVISGLITLSLRRNPTFEAVGGDLQKRVLALGRAHDFVRPHSEQSRSAHSHNSLFGMLESLLGAYQAAPGERVTVFGDDVRIDDRSATPLALFFHELATNAAKYGALAASDGHVTITVAPDGEDHVLLVWDEAGGPAVAPHPASGFGSHLIDMSITRQLGGTLRHDWRDEGLRVEARVPKPMMAR
ncbi:MAG: PAS domain S-box protein [Novosphingobium sp.]|nr:MAG: PAS domain S-box protein [Novosphingobium sp.]